MSHLLDDMLFKYLSKAPCAPSTLASVSSMFSSILKTLQGTNNWPINQSIIKTSSCGEIQSKNIPKLVRRKKKKQTQVTHWCTNQPSPAKIEYKFAHSDKPDGDLSLLGNESC